MLPVLTVTPASAPQVALLRTFPLMLPKPVVGFGF
jgi:hypothetical protein